MVAVSAVCSRLFVLANLGFGCCDYGFRPQLPWVLAVDVAVVVAVVVGVDGGGDGGVGDRVPAIGLRWIWQPWWQQQRCWQ